MTLSSPFHFSVFNDVSSSFMWFSNEKEPLIFLLFILVCPYWFCFVLFSMDKDLLTPVLWLFCIFSSVWTTAVQIMCVCLSAHGENKVSLSGKWCSNVLGHASIFQTLKVILNGWKEKSWSYCGSTIFQKLGQKMG